MANGKTAHENVAQVAAQCKSLETSPSCHSASSPIYHGGTRAVAHGSHSEHTGKLAHGKTTRPKPRGTPHHMGKKNLMAGKSHGR